jgi:hypothetical protein
MTPVFSGGSSVNIVGPAGPERGASGISVILLVLATQVASTLATAQTKMQGVFNVNARRQPAARSYPKAIFSDRIRKKI